MSGNDKVNLQTEFLVIINKKYKIFLMLDKTRE